MLFAAIALTACGGSRGHATDEPAGRIVVGTSTMALQWIDTSAGFAIRPGTPGTWRIATADVDGDGDLDVCFGDTLYRNLGGAFAAIPLPSTSLRRFAFGDIDGDGDLDLFGVDTTLHLWRNDGTGAFPELAPTWPAIAGATQDVALGDLDGDGDLDVVVAGSPDRVLRNDGASFTDVTATWLVGGSFATPQTVVLADFDGDGDVDLLAGDGTRFFRNHGTALVLDATVTLPPSMNAHVAVADIDGDGDRDVLVASAYPSPVPPYRLLRNDGTGHFLDISGQLPINPGNAFEIAGAAFGDVDGDGDQDLVWPLSNHLLRNQGNGTFTLDANLLPLPYCQGQACLFDADGDGDLDLATAYGGSPECLVNTGRALLRNDGTGRFQLTPPAVAAPPGEPFDFDGDAAWDLVDAYGLHRGQPDGGFALVAFPAVCTPAPALPPSAWGQGSLLLARDLDGDGGIDFVFAVTGSVYRHVGGFAWQATGNPTTAGASAAAALDFDRDGDLDLVIGRRDDTGDLPLVLLRNNGGGQFVDDSAHLPAAAFFAGAITAGDADGDGDDDLLVLSVRYPQPFFQLLRNDQGVFTASATVPLPHEVEFRRAITLADLDRDGRADVLVGGRGDSCLFHQQPDGSFTNESERLGLDALRIIRRAVANDLDGDGDLDIVTQSDEQRVFLQDAPFQFRHDEAARFAFPIDPLTLDYVVEQLTDIDGDGDLDLGTRRNATRHVRFLGTPTIGRNLRLEVLAQPTWLPSPRLAQVFVDLATTAFAATLPQGGVMHVGGPDATQLPTLAIPAPGGSATVDLAVPDLPALVGLPLRAQAWIVDPATGLGRPTNVARAVIGN